MKFVMDNRQFLALSSERVDLWLVFVDETYDQVLVSTYRSLLTSLELEQEKRFYFAKDSHRFLVTRALVRDVLSHYAPILPQDWRFESSEYGRPVIANGDAVAKRISFSISHTDGLIILGVTRDRALGIDAENITREAPIQFADSFFSLSEIRALRQLPTSLQSQRFFELWTLKESYIKARGIGLSIPLSQFSFNLDVDHQARIDFEIGSGDSPSQWCFWQWCPSIDYFAAICLERAVGDYATIIMRKVVPLLSSEILTSKILRTSVRY